MTYRWRWTWIFFIFLWKIKKFNFGFQSIHDPNFNVSLSFYNVKVHKLRDDYLQMSCADLTSLTSEWENIQKYLLNIPQIIEILGYLPFLTFSLVISVIEGAFPELFFFFFFFGFGLCSGVSLLGLKILHIL